MPQSSSKPGAFDVFRPRRGRVVALVVAVASLLLFGVVAILLPGPGSGGQWTPVDRVFFFGCGLAIAALLWRYASIRAVPSRQGLGIHNLVRSRTVEWRSVVAVQFSGGDPWVTLELDDTDQVAVMAIQKADGAYGKAEASRLAALVEALGTGPESPEVTLG